ncbi:MAG: TATA-box-binding protein [Promethearchaeota archaeon]|nr:MAG: TATA-box-binding protein [Candidatus Lokiarchaeota archaeon]
MLKEEQASKDNQEEKNNEEDLDYKIENVVATVTMEIQEKIDLTKIAAKYPQSEYNPERFPGLVMRVEKPRGTALIFSTGKMVVTGLRKASQADTVVEKIVKNITKVGIPIKNPQIIIQNIVASGDLHTHIDLNLAAVVMEYAMYEPEVFPGLIYRMQDPKSVFLLFSTGKIVCTGIKTEDVVANAVSKLNKEIRELGVAKSPGEMEDFQDLTFI